jgi:nitroreductase
MNSSTQPTNHSPWDDPWYVVDADFPASASLADQWRFLLNYVVLAPSSHNSQPWRFCVQGSALELYADHRRVLPVVDPEHRELLMSCGAALFHLRLALRHFGYAGEVEPFPRAISPHLLARVSLGERYRATHEEERLFAAIPHRRTNRQRFEEGAVPDATGERLRMAAEIECAWLSLVTDQVARERLADLIAEAERRQWADRAFRRELAAWLRTNTSRARDGMPGYAEGLGDLQSLARPLVVRTFDLGHGQAAKDHELACGAPILAVLGTEHDVPLDWLAAGQALARVLLYATVEGLAASFLNQPIEVPELRPEVGTLCGHAGVPQVLLRIGYGPTVRRTPRRPVAEVLVSGEAAWNIE